MKTLTNFIVEAGHAFRLVNWPSSRFTWIADYCKQYIKENPDADGRWNIETLMKYCQGLSKGWGLFSYHQPEHITSCELKFIYNLCKEHLNDENLTKPRKAKIEKTIKDIEDYMNFKNKNLDDIKSITEITSSEYSSQLKFKNRK